MMSRMKPMRMFQKKYAIVKTKRMKKDAEKRLCWERTCRPI